MKKTITSSVRSSQTGSDRLISLALSNNSRGQDKKTLSRRLFQDVPFQDFQQILFGGLKNLIQLSIVMLKSLCL